MVDVCLVDGAGGYCEATELTPHHGRLLTDQHANTHVVTVFLLLLPPPSLGTPPPPPLPLHPP